MYKWLLTALVLTTCLPALSVQPATPPSGLPSHYPVSREAVSSTLYPWSAVGMLNMAGNGSCTATLIHPRYIITAAHCLWNKQTGRWYPPAYIHFVAGFEQEEYSSHTLAHRIIISPDFLPNQPPTIEQAIHDWALIELQQSLSIEPIAAQVIDIEAGRRQENLLQAGYRFDRAYKLTVHSQCHLLKGSTSALWQHQCDTTEGDSGGPLLRKKEGLYELIAIYIGRITNSNTGIVVPTAHWLPTLKKEISGQ